MACNEAKAIAKHVKVPIKETTPNADGSNSFNPGVVVVAVTNTSLLEEQWEDDLKMIDVTNDLCPKICTANYELANMRSLLEGTLVLKILGRKVSYIVLKKRLEQLWSSGRPFTLVDLPNDYYLARFSFVEDRVWELSSGTWVIQGHYLTVSEWSLEFDPWVSRIEKTAVWVRVPSLPLIY
ncbi:hypothetical protein CRG98_021779 [Punica granatum]|uniref:DUF4283 domain-containing protein n=1 Tax=Punica granatum TaxID=22663 RepID=A0A2I0JPJ5_PUNGR|nr:hypothetical protein CRG98_021779 [Punica granatum]